ncbi:hypothetical protein [Alteromonas gracilis]|uniref:hypothetical protein n=1 Tax=Alteromonas gracilis TaxID=1479524 RepID=UPI0037365171
MQSSENKHSEMSCFSCGGSGEQASIHGENYPAEPCGLCHGDKVTYPSSDEDIKRPYLARG